ncbi:unnamed protein product [Spirodela intermedia]|uniref:Reverse transcriptase Ty1/copia-type domain-containing protein n=2 Tax=Spirodela intermedia TaxID=51605 RepID=A0A7I8JJ11_SPIIN|nr:unnamed protein product [Spirodela intermedia]CAA6669513.1 unnamed protein product [Spirodela intermedia]CAA7406475.1 unnamed protein product [Spirodela intermedia]
MEQPPRYIAHKKLSRCFSDLLITFNSTCYYVDPIVLTRKIEHSLIVLTIYVNDIFIIENDEVSIFTTKAYLQQHLSIRDLGTSQYFLEIEFAHQDRKFVITQRKYTFNILQGIGLLRCKLETSPMKAHLQFWYTSSLLFEDVNQYRCC